MSNSVRALGTVGGLSQSVIGFDNGTTPTDPDLVAGNIKKDVNILGVVGTFGNAGGAGSVIVYYNSYENSVSSAWAKMRDVDCLIGGTYTVKFTMRSNTSGKEARARIYVNGSATGTERTDTSGTYTVYTENITVSAGDNLQIYGYSPDGTALCYLKDFTVLAATNPLFTVVL